MINKGWDIMCRLSISREKMGVCLHRLADLVEDIASDSDDKHKEAENKLASEMGYRVTRNWHGGDDREARIEWNDGGYDITDRTTFELWVKAVELTALLGERP